ncbi:hypothetical protein MFLAVUS_002753 [Mucor flavus]|uniref:Chromo domain-containing protein n=1 Tax=Mucor flavus TaxID=439312 RepID=A0ABP9YR86_9FUNG
MGKKVQEEEYEVEYINSHKIETKKNKKTLKFEIKWKGYPAEQNTWETPEATENAKELVEQYWAIKGGGTAGRERCEKILSGELSESEEEDEEEEEEVVEEEEKPRSTRSSRKKPAAPTQQTITPSKRRKLLPTKKKEKIEYTSDDENNYFSESEIEKENFRLKGNWKSETAKVIQVRPSTKNGEKELYGVVRWRDGKLGLYKTSEISKRIPQKVVLVTGGSRGIGEMIATGFVSAGAKVYITSRSADVCYKVAAELTKQGPGQCFAIPADLQKLEEVTRLVAELSKKETHLDVLVNNAGANWNESIDTFPDAAFEKVVGLNLKRIFTLTQACLPLLTAKATKSETSSVINIGSIDGIRSPPQETYAYSASKGGLHHLSRHMAGKLGERGVRVNVIAPGAFQSKMMKATLEKFHDSIVSNIPVGRIGSPQDIAGTCIYLSSRAGQYTNGATITVDGGSMFNSNL